MVEDRHFTNDVSDAKLISWDLTGIGGPESALLETVSKGHSHCSNALCSVRMPHGTSVIEILNADSTHTVFRKRNVRL